MKKIFLFAFAGLLAIGFTSCNKDEKENENRPATPVVQKDFRITVNDITGVSATVTVVPADTLSSYYCSVMEASQYASYGSDEDFKRNEIDKLQTLIDLFVMYGYDVSWSDMLSVGTESYEFTLDPQREYIVFAFKMDTNKVTGDVVTERFSTPELVPADTIDLGFLPRYDFEDYREMDGSFTAYGMADGVEVALNIYDDDFVGNWTEEDMDLNYSYVWTSAMGSLEDDSVEDIVKAELVGTVDNLGMATVSGWVIATDLVMYTFSFDYTDYVEGKAPAKKVNAPKAVKIPKINKKLL